MFPAQETALSHPPTQSQLQNVKQHSTANHKVFSVYYILGLGSRIELSSIGHYFILPGQRFEHGFLSQFYLLSCEQFEWNPEGMAKYL